MITQSVIMQSFIMQSVIMLIVVALEQPSNLRRYGINNDRKKFYSIDTCWDRLLSFQTFFYLSSSLFSIGRHGIQQNDIQHNNDTQQNDI